MEARARLDLYLGKAEANSPKAEKTPGSSHNTQFFASHPENPSHNYQVPPSISAYGETTANKDFLFLDLECIQLGHGPNNTTWLIGLAWFENGQLAVQQLFSETPLDESERIAEAAGRLKEHPRLVTYNGRSFDIPLLRSRPGALDPLWRSLGPAHHHDLYLSLRKCAQLPRYRLIDSEAELLGFNRVDDMPGSMAGQAYFEYQKWGDREKLDGIMEHNRLDLLSLASLFLVFETAVRRFKDSLETGAPYNGPIIRPYRAVSSLLEHQGLPAYLQNTRQKDRHDHVLLARYHHKKKQKLLAAGHWRRAFQKGHNAGLLRSITALKRTYPSLARTLLEHYLPLVEAPMQEKLLVVKKKMN